MRVWSKVLFGFVVVFSLASQVLASHTQAEASERLKMTFPVEGHASFYDDFGDFRSGGRTHHGNDLMGDKLQRLIATVDGTITFFRSDAAGRAGNMITITDDSGWQYRYMHLNNDSPGTDDGANPREWIAPMDLDVGSRVVAGQVIGFMGDSGNAEDTPTHLHFEIHRPDGSVINPYGSLLIATRTTPDTNSSNGGYYVTPWFGLT